MQAVMYNPWNLQCRRLNKENIFCEFMNFIFTFLMKILTAGQKEFWYFDELESTLTELCLLGTRFIEKTDNFENPTFHQFTKVKRKMHVVWIRIRIFRIQFGARSELI